MSSSECKIVTLAKTNSTKNGGLIQCCNTNKLILLSSNRRDIYLYSLENSGLLLKQKWRLENDAIHISIKSGDSISKSSFYALDIHGSLYELKVDVEYKANKKKRTFDSISLNENPHEVKQIKDPGYQLVFKYKNAYSILHMGSAILIASKEGPNIQLLMKDKVENSFFNRTGLCYSSVFAPNTINMFGINSLSPNLFKLLFGEEFLTKPQLILVSGFEDGKVLFSPLSKGRRGLEYHLLEFDEIIINIIPFCTSGAISNGLLFIGNNGKVHILWEDNVLHSSQIHLNMPISQCIIIDKTLLFISRKLLWYSTIKIDENEMTLSVPSQVNIKPYVSNILLVKSDIIIYTYHGEILSVDKSTLINPSMASKKKVTDFQLKDLLSQLSHISSKQEYMREKNQKLNTSIEKINSALHTISDIVNQKSVICLIKPKVDIMNADINKNIMLQIKLIFTTKVKDESQWTLYLRVSELHSTMIYGLKLSSFLLSKKSDTQSNYLLSLPINVYSLNDISITSYLSFTISKPNAVGIQFKPGFYKEHINGIEHDIMIFLNTYHFNLLDLLYLQKHDNVALHINQPLRKLTINEYVRTLVSKDNFQLSLYNLSPNITLNLHLMPNLKDDIFKSLGHILEVQQLNDITEALMYTHFMDPIRLKLMNNDKQLNLQIHCKSELIPYIRSICIHRLCNLLKKSKKVVHEDQQMENMNYGIKLSGNLKTKISNLSSDIRQFEKDIEQLYIHTLGESVSPFESNVLLIRNYNNMIKIYTDFREFTDKNLEL